MLFAVTNGMLEPADYAARAFVDGRTGTVDLERVSAVKRRSMDQNRLYWAWCGDIARSQGWDAEYAHCYNKWHYGLAILARKHPEYRDTMMQMLRRLEYETRLKAMKLVACTSEFTVEMMTEYLDTVQRHWAAEGVKLINGDEL